MATGKCEDEIKVHQLKHLGFVRVAAIQAFVCFSNLYEYSKQNSGPLKSTVGTVEGAVTSVLGPVYEKFKGVPDDLLVFLDRKADEVADKFDKHAPPLAKEAVNRARILINKTSQEAQKLLGEAQALGPRAAAQSAATEYKQFLLSQSVKMWVLLNKCRPFHAVSALAVPTAAQWSEKYNHAVNDMARKGYSIIGYLPRVPVKEIAKAFKQDEEGKKEACVTFDDSSHSHTD